MIARLHSFCNMFLYVLNSVINKVSNIWSAFDELGIIKQHQQNDDNTSVALQQSIGMLPFNKSSIIEICLYLWVWLIPWYCVSAIEKRYITIEIKKKTLYRAGQGQWWTAGQNLYKQNATSCLMVKLCGCLYHWLYTKYYISDAYKMLQLCMNLVWTCLVDTLIQWIVEIWIRAIISVSHDCMAETMTSSQNHNGKGFGYCPTSEQKVWPLMRTRNSWSWTTISLAMDCYFKRRGLVGIYPTICHQLKISPMRRSHNPFLYTKNYCAFNVYIWPFTDRSGKQKLYGYEPLWSL